MLNLLRIIPRQRRARPIVRYVMIMMFRRDDVRAKTVAFALSTAGLSREEAYNISLASSHV